MVIWGVCGLALHTSKHGQSLIKDCSLQSDGACPYQSLMKSLVVHGLSVFPVRLLEVSEVSNGQLGSVWACSTHLQTRSKSYIRLQCAV
jgi:hypothetical protein